MIGTVIGKYRIVGQRWRGATGIVFYRLLAGRRPFESETPTAMLQKQMAELPQPFLPSKPMPSRPSSPCA